MAVLCGYVDVGIYSLRLAITTFAPALITDLAGLASCCYRKDRLDSTVVSSTIATAYLLLRGNYTII